MTPVFRFSADATDEVRSDRSLVDQRPTFSLLLDTSRQSQLRDACLRLYSEATTPAALNVVKEISTLALSRLHEAVQRATTDLCDSVQLMADACHGAWVLSTLLKTSSSRCGGALPAISEVGRRPIDEVTFLISALCLEGPQALRPALIPCIALLLEGRGHLLSLHPSLLESLRAGLTSSGKAARARTAETVVRILKAPPGEHGPEATVGQLSMLQPALLRFLGTDAPQSAVTSVLEALEELSISGVLATSQALPRLLVECLVGGHKNAEIAHRLVLRLMSADSHGVPGSILPAIKQAADLLSRRGVGPEEVVCSLEGSAWRRLRDTMLSELSQEILSRSLKSIFAGLKSVCGGEAGHQSASPVMVVALCLNFVVTLARDHDALSTAIEDSGIVRHLTGQQHPGGVWPLQTCLVGLVMAAVSNSRTCDVLSRSSSVMTTVGTALEELALAAEDEQADGAKLMQMYTVWKKQLPELSRPADDSKPTVIAQEAGVESPREKDAQAERSEPLVRRNISSRVDANVSTNPGALDIPSYAAYDASCDKWRCTLCAKAGGRNPYAKGMTIEPSLVAMRMRIHARSAVHKKAVESLTSKPEKTEDAGRGCERLVAPRSQQNPAARVKNEGADVKELADAGFKTSRRTADFAANIDVTSDHEASKRPAAEPWMQLEALCKRGRIGGA